MSIAEYLQMQLNTKEEQVQALQGDCAELRVEVDVLKMRVEELERAIQAIQAIQALPMPPSIPTNSTNATNTTNTRNDININNNASLPQFTNTQIQNAVNSVPDLPLTQILEKDGDFDKLFEVSDKQTIKQ